MYFDEPAPAFERSRDWVEGLLIAAGALFVSPVGYLLIGTIDQLSRNAAGSLF
jgi:NADH-quinone oxidoreductase subunit N